MADIDLRNAADLLGAVSQVNPRPTPLDPVARVNLHGSAARVLPALVEAVWPAARSV